MSADFQALGLSTRLLRALARLGFRHPTPIQAQTIPPALQGRDILGQAQTGSGKTLAFGAPILERLGARARLPRALVVTPTRELAIQVTEAIAQLTDGHAPRLLAVFGGHSMDLQVAALAHGVDVVVGTPGRLLDHLYRGTLDPSLIATLVLDEADEMLDMGFLKDVEKLIACLPAERQTMLFSATLPAPVRRIAERFMRDPVHVRVEDTAQTTPDIAQAFIEVRGERAGTLCRLLRAEPVERAIVFCRTKQRTAELARTLQGAGLDAIALHGDLTQAERNRVMRQFRRGQSRILVATDVAARGIDVRQVSHVVNYDCPQKPDAYIHRIGRTGRAGRSGTALTFVHPRERRLLQAIERRLGTRIGPYRSAAAQGA